MKIRNQKNFVAGLMFIVTGIFFAALATGYQMGTPAKMGSGYFPFYLGTLLSLLGLFIFVTSMTPNSEESVLTKWDWKSVLWITGSVLVFAVSLNYAGLIISLALLMLVSALASHEFGWKGTLVSMVILISAVYLGFVWGLKLQFPVWPYFLNN
ncbi:MAG: tripartite tricarboxylate transporter TctB family protein [Betaproteobacteria bacterium]